MSDNSYGTWVKCNRCFNDMDVVMYPEGIYIIPCSCLDEKTYHEGFSEGFNMGKEDGYSVGEGDGYNEGKADGVEVGFKRGYDEGFKKGREEGYAAGKEDNYSHDCLLWKMLEK